MVLLLYRSNWDGAKSTGIAEAWDVLFEKKRAVISKAQNIAVSNDAKSVDEANVNIEWLKDYIGKDDNPAEPASDIHYPILEDAADMIRNDENNSGKVVALLTSTFFWRDLIKDILPPGSIGIVGVFENSCGQTFTYQINGPEVVYLGNGDFHENQYDHLRISADLNAIDAYATPTDRSYTGVPLSSEHCPYRLHMYPSAEMAEDYLTKKPITFTVTVVAVFAFTSFVFVCYDQFVQKAQRQIMYKALQSKTNIEMLEKMVKERTKELEDSNRRLEVANRKVTAASAAQLQHFAQISHEIRTPLNCILGLSSLLQDSELTPMQEESIRMMNTSGNLLLTVVNDVLDYSRLESGNVDIEAQRTNLQEVLNAVVSSIGAKAQSKRLTMRTVYDASLCEFINTDGRRLQQVRSMRIILICMEKYFLTLKFAHHPFLTDNTLLKILYNLLGNAVKFSEEGGDGIVELSVWICSSGSGLEGGAFYSPSEPSSTQMADGSKVLRFSVKDWGQGINEKDLKRSSSLFFKQAQKRKEYTEAQVLALPLRQSWCTGWVVPSSLKAKRESGPSFPSTFHLQTHLSISRESLRNTRIRQSFLLRSTKIRG